MDLETIGYWDIPRNRFFCKKGGHRLPKGAESQPVMRFEVEPGLALHGSRCVKCGVELADSAVEERP